MKKTRNHISFVYPVLVLATSSIGIATIINNLKTGTYHINQDSIGLPIGTIILVCLALIIMQVLQLPHHTRVKKGRSTGILLRILSLISGITSTLLLAASMIYWFAPEHIIISIFYGISTIAFAALQIQSFRKN
jgi:hypothetical protein